MLPRRLATTTLNLRRSAISSGIPKSNWIPRRCYADPPTGAPAAAEPVEKEVLSVPFIQGVPIVSNYETPQGHTHPDPNLTGGYVNPPAEKRQFRSPYTEYWNQQDRRNYGEPVNEDEDILGRLSPEVYTWTTPKMGLIQNGLFVLTVLGLCGIVYVSYPDKPAVPRTFPYDGLKYALGEDLAPSAKSDSEE